MPSENSNFDENIDAPEGLGQVEIIGGLSGIVRQAGMDDTDPTLYVQESEGYFRSNSGPVEGGYEVGFFGDDAESRHFYLEKLMDHLSAKSKDIGKISKKEIEQIRDQVLEQM